MSSNRPRCSRLKSAVGNCSVTKRGQTQSPLTAIPENNQSFCHCVRAIQSSSSSCTPVGVLHSRLSTGIFACQADSCLHRSNPSRVTNSDQFALHLARKRSNFAHFFIYGTVYAKQTNRLKLGLLATKTMIFRDENLNVNTPYNAMERLAAPCRACLRTSTVA